MKQILKALIIAGSMLLASSAAWAAGEKGTADEAVAMVKKAGAFIKANGREKAFAEFNNTKGQFNDRDLYIVVFDMNGKNLAHGANPKLIGKDLIDIKDVDGKLYMRERIDLIKSKGKGWQDYKFVNPVSKQIEPKAMYIEKFDDLIVGCGIYK